MELVLPTLKLKTTTDSDPAYIYNSTNRLLRYIYVRRLKIGLDLLDGRYDRVLDLGTGSGITIPSLARSSSAVVGLDRHSRLREVEEDMESLGLRNFDLIRGDVCHLPFPKRTFDLVISMSLLEHLPDVERAVKEIRSIIKDDGTLVVGIPIENRITELRYHYFKRRYGAKPCSHISSYRNVQRAVERYFDIVDSKRLIPFAPVSLSMYWAMKCSPRRITPGDVI